MDRVRFECRLHANGQDLPFYATDTAAILGIVSAVCSGAQVSRSIKLTVVDTAGRDCPRASIGAETCLGFPVAAESFLQALDQRQSRPLREGEGRDVVVEVHFAAHGATLEQCRNFARHALDDLLGKEAWQRDHGEQPQFGGLFSPNGEGVGDAWFL